MIFNVVVYGHGQHEHCFVFVVLLMFSCCGTHWVDDYGLFLHNVVVVPYGETTQ